MKCPLFGKFALILGCATAVTTTPLLAAGVPLSVDYTDGENNTSSLDTGTVDTAILNVSTGIATQSGSISGAMGVTKTGAGTLILTAPNTYDGNTVVSGGVMEVSSTGIIDSSMGRDGGGYPNLRVGYNTGEVGTLRITGGVVKAHETYLGDSLGATGTVTVSAGVLDTEQLTVGNGGTGVFNMSSSISSGWFIAVGAAAGSQGTVNISGGLLVATLGDFGVGLGGTGVLNLTNSGAASSGIAGNGSVVLAADSGSNGTLNIGTGGVAGTLLAGSVTGGDGTAVVNFNHSNDIVFAPQLTGNLTVNQIGSGRTTLHGSHDYTGGTFVLGGTLELAFGDTLNNILDSSGDLTLGSGTLSISGKGSQTFASLNQRDYSGGSVVLGTYESLTLGTLAVGTNSALHFDVSAGGANQETFGSAVVQLTTHVAGAVINPGVTITDAAGFGLATTAPVGYVMRDATTALLPASGADAGTNYLINNNNGDGSAGSATLHVTASESAQSITVDTTARTGVLSLASGQTLQSDVWNFGGLGAHGYTITAADDNAGLSTRNAGGALEINNWNNAPVTIAAAIHDNSSSNLLVNGTGTLILTGQSDYKGGTAITAGTVVLDMGGSINNSAAWYVGLEKGSNAVLNVKNGSFSGGSGGAIGTGAGSTGTVIIGSNGYLSQGHALVVGKGGTGVVDVNGGLLVTDSGILGSEAGSSGTANIRGGGHWNMSISLTVGSSGTGVLNITEGSGLLIGEGMGTVTVGSGSTVNLGLGGAAGLLGVRSVTGTDSSSVMNFDFNAETGPMEFYGLLQGGLAVNKLGSGVVTFTAQNTYTGATTVNGGVLELDISEHAAISSESPVVLGGGTLRFTGGGEQSLGSLTTTADTGSAIVLGSDESISVGGLRMGASSALNFNTAAGGASGGEAGTASIFISGLTRGEPISNSFTVTDSTGFGLATVGSDGEVIRLTDTTLMPASGSSASVDYLINGSNGSGYTDAGSLNMMISSDQAAKSITVDTTAQGGAITLDHAGVSADVWNFGGSTAGNGYQITGFDQVNGLTPTTYGGVLQMNNYMDGKLFLFSPILDYGGSGLLLTGTGMTVMFGTNTYTGDTTLNSGMLIISGDESAATGATTVQTGGMLGGTGTLGGDLVVQQGGTLTPGSFLQTGYQGGTLSGTTASFESGSVFSVHGSGAALPTLHLSGAATIAAGAYLNLTLDGDLTQNSYTLISAASGLDGSTPFTLMYADMLPSNYKLVYTGTALQLNLSAVATAYWTGAVSSKWSDLSNGSSNWATTVDGTTDTNALPTAPTDVFFAASNAATTDTILDTDFTINSLTVNSDTTISRTDDPHTLTVNGATTVNALLAVNFGVTLSGGADLTVSSTGTLAGDGTVQMAEDKSMYIYGTIDAGRMNSPDESGPLTLTTSGSGSIIMGAGSVIVFDLNYGAGDGDNTGAGQALSSDHLSLHGTLDATAGGTLVIHNPNVLTNFAGGDKWQLVNLNAGNDDGVIVGKLAVDDSALGLAMGMAGTFDQSTGIYTIADHRGELSAVNSGLPMAGAEIQGVIAAAQTATTDVNNHLFNLRSGGGGDEDDAEDGSISAAMDYGVVMGQGDGPESPMMQRLSRSQRWEVFSTVAYGNVRLNPINTQAGVQIDSWASSVGVERYLGRGLTLGFAATFLQSQQTYTGGLGSLDLEGPTLSAYLAYARKGVWASLMYSFGDYDLGSQRNPGFALPMASGATTAYVNSLQFNTGYNFYFQDRTLVTGPFIGIDYLHGSVDAYSETGGGVGALAFARQSFDSLVTRVGWSASKKLHTDWADITPQFRVSYERQNIHNNGTSVQVLNAPFTATGGSQMPGRDYMVLGGGVNFQITPALSILLNYQTQIFREGMTSHFGSIRVGYKF